MNHLRKDILKDKSRFGSLMDQKPEYRKISLPSELAEKIEHIIRENPDLGYKTIAEFVKESVRFQILKLEGRTKELIDNMEEKRRQTIEKFDSLE